MKIKNNFQLQENLEGFSVQQNPVLLVLAIRGIAS